MSLNHNKRFLPAFNYFMWMVNAIPGLGVMYYLQNALGLQPYTFGIVLQVVAIPWLVKPLWGILCDLYPLGGERRRSYILMGCIVNAVSFSALASGHISLYGTIGFLAVSSLSMAISDVAVDAMVVDIVKEEFGDCVGDMQSRIAMARTIGSATGAIISFLYFLQYSNPLHLFAITAACTCILLFLCIICLRDIPLRRSLGVNKSISTCRVLCKHLRTCVEILWVPDVYGSMLFIIMWGCVPSSGTGMWYYITEPTSHGGLGISKKVVALMQVVAGIVAAVGIYIYRKYMHVVSLRTFLCWMIVLTSILSMVPVIVTEHLNGTVSPIWFIFGDDVLLSAAFRVTILPIAILCAYHCPRGSEGTVYAGMMSIVNIADMIGDTLGTMITSWLDIKRGDDGHVDFSNITTLVVIASLTMLIPILLLRLVPKKLPRSMIPEIDEEKLFGIVGNDEEDEVNVNLHPLQEQMPLVGNEKTSNTIMEVEL